MRMKDNKFFSFFEPVLKYIDTGKFFRDPSAGCMRSWRSSTC